MTARPGWLLLCSIAAASLVPAGSGHAQDELRDVVSGAVWIGAPAQSDAQEHPDAVRAATRALRERAGTIFPVEMARERLGHGPLRECHQASCAGPIAQALGVDFVALVTVWTGDDGRPNQIVVTVVDAEGRPLARDQPVPEGGSAEAVAEEVAAAAYADYRAAALSALAVHSDPAGARVELDDRAVGTTPLRRLVRRGRYRLRLVREGYEPFERELTVAQAREDLGVLPLSRLHDAGGSGSEPDLVANLLLGGVLAVAGVPLLAAGLVNAGLDGQCARPSELDPSECQERYRFDVGRDATLLAIGGALLVAGIVLLAVQPIRVVAAASPSSAWLELEGTF